MPWLYNRLAFGTAAFRVDLVDPAIKFTPTIQTRALSSFPFFSFPSPHAGGTFAQVKILGSLAELDFISRNNDVCPSYLPAAKVSSLTLRCRIPLIMPQTLLP